MGNTKPVQSFSEKVQIFVLVASFPFSLQACFKIPIGQEQSPQGQSSTFSKRGSGNQARSSTDATQGSEGSSQNAPESSSLSPDSGALDSVFDLGGLPVANLGIKLPAALNSIRLSGLRSSQTRSFSSLSETPPAPLPNQKRSYEACRAGFEANWRLADAMLFKRDVCVMQQSKEKFPFGKKLRFLDDAGNEIQRVLIAKQPGKISIGVCEKHIYGDQGEFLADYKQYMEVTKISSTGMAANLTRTILSADKQHRYNTTTFTFDLTDPGKQYAAHKLWWRQSPHNFVGFNDTMIVDTVGETGQVQVAVTFLEADNSAFSYQTSLKFGTQYGALLNRAEWLGDRNDPLSVAYKENTRAYFDAQGYLVESSASPDFLNTGKLHLEDSDLLAVPDRMGDREISVKDWVGQGCPDTEMDQTGYNPYAELAACPAPIYPESQCDDADRYQMGIDMSPLPSSIRSTKGGAVPAPFK